MKPSHIKSIHKTASVSRLMRGLLGVSLAFPVCYNAYADAPPEQGILAFKYLSYKDSQPGADRISVHAPSVMLMLPVAGQWSFEAVRTADTVSGASPRYHSEKRSLSTMHDVRRAEELRVTRYFPQGTLTVGTSYSSESDYVSRAYSVSSNLSTEDHNTTLHLGYGLTRDEINPANLAVVDESKLVSDFLVGVTQVLTQRDIAQLNITHGQGKGYFSDPYKFFDHRPRTKHQTSLLLRWNHHFDGTDGTSRLAYRYYTDSFGIRSHTLTAEYVQGFQSGWTVTPMVRIYSQNAADFYLGPINPPGPSIPIGFVLGTTLLSEDQRLSAFGARSFGVKLAKQVGKEWLFDLKYEYYQQKSDWCLTGGGSPGIDQLQARILQVGISRYF